MRPILKWIILTIREMLLRIISPLLRKTKHEFSIDQIKRILIIRLDGIGDLVLSIPAIKALRRRFPLAHITLMTTETTQDLLKGASYINEVIVLRKKTDLKKLSFDLIFDLLDDYSLKPVLIAYSIKAKFRAGFDIKGRGVFFDLKIPDPGVKRHYIDAMLDLVEMVGARAADHSPEIHISTSEQDDAVHFLRMNNVHEGDKVICIHPGGICWTKRWLPDRFAQLAEELIRKRSVKVIFVGAEYDRELIDQIRRKIPEKTLSCIGQPLRSIAALIQQSDVMVWNNGMLE